MGPPWTSRIASWNAGARHGLAARTSNSPRRVVDEGMSSAALARYWLDGSTRPDTWVYFGRLRRFGRYLEDAAVNLLSEPGREPPAIGLLRALNCPEDDMPATLDGFHAAARKVLAQFVM